MSNVATAFLQAELMDDCDEMEVEDAREQRALGAFAFLFSPEDTMVECQDCKIALSLDLAIPSETVCAFRCEKCDVQHKIAKKTPLILTERVPAESEAFGLTKLRVMADRRRDEAAQAKHYAI